MCSLIYKKLKKRTDNPYITWKICLREKNNIQKKYCVLVYQSDLVTANWFFLTPDNLKHQIWWLKTPNRPPPTSDWGNHSINWSHRTYGTLNLVKCEIDFFLFSNTPIPSPILHFLCPIFIHAFQKWKFVVYVLYVIFSYV